MLHLEEIEPTLIRVCDEDGDPAYFTSWSESLVHRLTDACHNDWPGKWVPSFSRDECGAYLSFVPGRGRGRPKTGRTHRDYWATPEQHEKLKLYLEELQRCE
jgi:hypothetical protein